MNLIQMIIRLALATILGGLIGLEREKHGRVAGFRTHVLVTVGSALIMMVSLHLYDIFLTYHTPAFASGVDPSRIASMVVAGIGFIGAGTIIKSKGTIWGLTTASCLWMAAALGLAIGCGYYIPAIIATILALTTLVILKRIERLIKSDSYYNIEICMEDRKDGLEDIKEIFHEFNLNILKICFVKDIKKGEKTYKINVRTRSFIDDKAIDRISQLTGVKGITCL